MGLEFWVCGLGMLKWKLKARTSLQSKPRDLEPNTPKTHPKAWGGWGGVNPKDPKLKAASRDPSRAKDSNEASMPHVYLTPLV